MKSLLPPEFNPIEHIETVALCKDYPSERPDMNEVIFYMNGQNCDYQVSASWNEDTEILQVSCSFFLGKNRKHELKENELGIYRLLGYINQQVQIGHFDYWADENAIVWRFGQAAQKEYHKEEYFERLFGYAPDVCDQYYASFHFVVWSDASPELAALSCLIETEGGVH